ncbi:OmpA family protein [candidate division KSB1 bacterium]|nr:OmpA family protein [candidate division KSB1 bacterium]
MPRHNIFCFVLIIMFIIHFSPDRLNAETDSLRVRIVNTPQPVGSMRFVERDSSNFIVRVMDESGEAFPELTTNQVQVSRGDKSAKIVKVVPLSASVETNLNVLLALDNSASMDQSTKELLKSVQLLINSLKNRSQIGLQFFSESEKIVESQKSYIGGKLVKVNSYDFTEDTDEVMRIIHFNYASQNLSLRTYLYDEIVVGLDRFKNAPTNLVNVMIVFSDGADLGSESHFNDVLKAAKATGVTIYAIDYSPESDVNQILEKIVRVTPQGKIFKAKRAVDLIPVFEMLSKELITEFQVTYHFPIPPSGTVQFDGQNLLIKTRKLKDEFPMLNYVFFDSNSTEINSRYHQFSTAEAALNFDETTIQRSLDKYYHVLNIIGSRARNDSTAQLTIKGCNMNLGAEKGNLSLSRNRAQNIADYLQNIWGIAPGRIKILAQNLPLKASSNNTPAGQAENRRVEITSNHSNIIRPIYSEVIESFYTPEIGQFKTNIQVPEGLKEWTFTAWTDEQSLVQIKSNRPEKNLSWNWLNQNGEKIRNISQLHFAIKIIDNDEKVFETVPKILPITEIQETANVAEVQQDTMYEKFSLILFDFNSSKLSTNNQYLMQKVLDSFQQHPDAMIKVYGFCDDIGTEEYNLKLSTDRAKISHGVLRTMGIPAKQLSFVGYGETNPIFTNQLPEGRFLNRTVQVYIGYPSGEMAQK